VVNYIPSTIRNQGTFETLWDINYGSLCLMQALFMTPLTYSSQPQTMILSGGTDGSLNLSAVTSSFSPTTTPGPVPFEVHRTHQSGILALDAIALTPEIYLIATGGDDNALGLTILASHSPSGSMEDSSQLSQHHFRTLVVPRAHAAALTALKLLNLTRTAAGCSVTVITVGNDQRIKIWDVHVNTEVILLTGEEDKSFAALQVSRRGSAWTSVADVSSVEIIEESRDWPDRDVVSGMNSRPEEEGDAVMAKYACKIMVVGVGMELLGIEWGQNV